MESKKIHDKLFIRIRPLVNFGLQAEIISRWYLELGPRRIITILKELMDEERAISQREVGEHERKMFEIKAAKCELEKVVGE